MASPPATISLECARRMTAARARRLTKRILACVKTPRRTLAVLLLELLHERHQRIDAVFRERVVDRRAHAAHRPVALEAVESGGRRFLDELALELLARQPERDVHA